MGASDDFADSAPTANTLRERSVFVDPHFGHFCLSAPLIVRTSWSNFD
jgi:hypothetical protein